MPARSEEEKARRKSDYLQRVAARKAARQGTTTESNSETTTNAVQTTTISPTPSSHTSYFNILPEDTIHTIFFFLTARELGAMTLTCKALNETLKEGRVSHLLSRLKHGTYPSHCNTVGHCMVPLNLCQNSADSRVSF